MVENIPILLEGAIELFMALVEAIPEIVVQLTQALPQIIEAIITGLSRLPELLWNILLVCIGKFTNWGNQSEETGKALRARFRKRESESPSSFRDPALPGLRSPYVR